MVVSRSDATKRRRKEGNVLDSSLRESPKRAKVHAQRKFAQGSSNPTSLALTPIKDKEKVKNNEVATPSPELVPSKRPKTEDFLTFLCFRGTSLLPASLDLFSVASAQESQDDDVPQHGESSVSRDCVRNSRSTPTIPPAIAANRASSRSTDRAAGDAPVGQGVATAGRSERPDAECKRRPSTAVQALRKKYQEQRLAKQKADTLRKLAQKVKGKNMMRTRSSTLKEQAVKIVRPVAAIPVLSEPIRRTTKPAEHKKKAADAGSVKPASDKRMSTRGRTSYQGSPHDTADGRRREGLRSGNAALSEEPVVQRSQRVAKVVNHNSLDKTITPAEKEKKDKIISSRFASTLSDFSSDDDQPLVKKVKPVESSQQQHARKVVKRIVQSAKKVKSRMMTRSRVHKQDDVTVRSPPPARPTRKTKEAAALYMELLGKKLATPDADLDDDSLSVDSFPELPNARQNERRENELKAKAMKLLESRSQKSAHKNVGVKEPTVSSQKTNQLNQSAVRAGDRNKREEMSVVSQQRRSAVGDKAKSVALFRSKRIFMRKEKLQSLNNKVEIIKEVADKRNVQCEVIKKEKHLQIKTISEHIKKESSSQSEFLKKRKTVQTEFVKKNKSLHIETGKSEKLQKECVLKSKQLNERERREKPHNEVDRKNKPLNEVDKRDKPLIEVDKRDKPLIEVDKRDKPLIEVDKRDKPLIEVDKRDKPLIEVDKRDKPYNEVDRKDKPLNEVDRKIKPLSEVDRKEKLRNAVERKEKLCNEMDRKEKLCNEIGKKEKSHNEMVRKEKPYNERERKEKSCKDMEGKEKSQNKTEKKEKLYDERERKEKPHNETGKKEKTCSEIEKKKFVKSEVTKKENYQTDSSKKETLQGSIAKEQHLSEAVKSGTRSKNTITEVDVKNESAVCGKTKESIQKNIDASVMQPRRSQRRGSHQWEPATEKTEMQTGATKAQQSSAQCKSARSEREAEDGFEDKFSDSDEEPLGKIALKNTVNFELINCGKSTSDFKGDCRCRKGTAKVVSTDEAPILSTENNSLGLLLGIKRIKSEELKKMRREGRNVKPACVKKINNSHGVNNNSCNKVETKKGIKLSSQNQDNRQDVEEKGIGKKIGSETLLGGDEEKKLLSMDENEGKMVKDAKNDPAIMKVPIVSVSNIDVRKVMKSSTVQKSKANSNTGRVSEQCTLLINRSNISLSEEFKSEANEEVKAGDVNNCAQESSTNSNREHLQTSSCLLSKSEAGVGSSSTHADTKQDRAQLKPVALEKCVLPELSIKIPTKKQKQVCVSNTEPCTSVGKNEQRRMFDKRKNRRKQFRKSIPRGSRSDKSVCKMEFPCRRNTLKRHMKRVSSKKCFQMNKHANVHMLSPNKCQPDTSHFEVASDSTSNRFDLDKDVNKFDNAKINIFTSSPLKISSPFPSPSKKLRCKDLKGKRKVNMSTEQIEKWLNESYIEDAQEEKECGLCSKTDCKCSASSIDEELAHLSQFAMEKLTLGSGSECDALEDGRKKSSSSIDGASCYLQDVVECQVDNPEVASTSKPDHFENGHFAETSEAAASKEADLELESLFNNSFSAIENITESGKNISANSISAIENINASGKTIPVNSFSTIENINESDKNISINSFSAIENISESDKNISINSLSSIENITEPGKNISGNSFNTVEIISESNKNISLNSLSSIENITESGKNISGNSFNNVEIITESGKNIPINSFSTIDNISEPGKNILINSFSTIKNTNKAGKNISVECLDVDGEGSDLDKAIIASQHEHNLQTVPLLSTNVSSEKPVNTSEKSVDVSLESSVSSTLATANTETSCQQEVMQPLPLYTSSAQHSLVSSHVSLPSTILSYSEHMNAEPHNCIASSQQSVTPSSNQLVSTHNHSSLQSTSLMAPLFQQTQLPSTLSQSVIGTAHQPVVFITSQSNNTPNITMEEPKPAVISQTLQQTVNLMPQSEQSTSQQLVDHATQQSLKAGDVIVQQANTLGQQNNSSLMVDATAVQASMPSVQQTMISSIHRSAVSSFHPTVSLPFELTQCISSPAQSRTITLPLQQPIGQLFQHSVNSSFQQAGGIIIQQANPSPLQQSISLQLQQQGVGLPCHQTVTLPLQQLAFVPIKSVSLQLQQQVANIPLQQTIASTLPQTVSASLHQAVPLHQAANMHLQQTNSILFHQQTQMQQPTFQQQILHQEGIGPTRPMSSPKTTLPQPSEHMQQQTLLQTSTPQLLQQMQTEPKQLISVQTSLTMLPHMCASLQQSAPQKVPSPQMATLLQQSTYQQPPTLSKLVQPLEPCLQQPTPQQVSLQKVDLAAESSKQVPPKDFVFKHSNISTSSELNFLPNPEILQTSENTQRAASQEQMSCVQTSQLLTGSETLVDQQLTCVQEQTFEAPIVSAMSATSVVLTASPLAASVLPETSGSSEQQQTSSKQVALEESTQSIPATVAQSVTLQQESSVQSSEISCHVVPSQFPEECVEANVLQSVHEANISTPEPVAMLSNHVVLSEFRQCQQFVEPEVSHEIQTNQKELNMSEQPESQLNTNILQFTNFEDSVSQPISTELVSGSTVKPDDLKSKITCMDSHDAEQSTLADMHQCSALVSSAGDEPIEILSNETECVGEEQPCDSLSENSLQVTVEQPFRAINDAPVEEESKTSSASVHGCSAFSEGSVKEVNKNARNVPGKETGSSSRNEKFGDKYAAQKTGLRVVRIRKDIDKDQLQDKRYLSRTTTHSQTSGNTGISEKAKPTKYYSKFILQRGSGFKMLGDKSGRGLGRKDYLTIRKQRTPAQKSIFQKSRSFSHKVSEQKQPVTSTNAFSLEDESSVYAFKTELELSPINTPFRRHARDSRTSSTTTSRSEEDLTRAFDDDLSSPLAVSTLDNVAQQFSEKLTSTVSQQTTPFDHSSSFSKCVIRDLPVTRNSASIAVQVNLDNEPSPEPTVPTVTASEPNPVEPLPQRSMECSTQTEVSEEDENDGHLFYIPLQQTAEGKNSAPSQQLIQGVTVKLGTEGSAGSNQCVIMRAKLVTKAPSFSCSPGIQDSSNLGTRRTPLSSQHPRASNILMVEQKLCSTAVPPLISTSSTYPPVGTVQPTARARPITTHSDATTATSDRPAGPEPRKSPARTVLDSGSQTAGQSGFSSRAVTRPQQRHRMDVHAHVGGRRSSVEQAAASSFIHKTTPSYVKRGLQKPKTARSCEVNYLCTPVSVAKFPAVGSRAQLVEAPIYHPTEKEFQDPIEYIDKIRPVAEKFGLCRIVPPSTFKPECKVTDDMRFTAYNQYVHKMLHRWGPNVMEMMAIKKYLATQSIALIHPPLIGGMEVDLPRLYQTVQNLGGLKDVIEKKKWQRVAEGMRIPKSTHDRATKLDDIYCKYLLPYDTLSPAERNRLFIEVEREWHAMESAGSSQDSAATSDATEDEPDEMTEENQECIVKGRSMPLNAFYRIARNTMSMWFRQPEPSASEVEQEFWKHVMTRQCHVCVHSGSIDSSGWGYGFPCSKNSPFAKHPWNLKVLTNNSGSILRSMGPVMGVTVPTLHVGMVFTTCCWYRDPHGLPWIEYLHTGARKIWYGIPDEYSFLFRAALSKLVPRYCRNKTIWLPSDTAMVPPSLLVKEGVSLCHTVQEPGQFILVFPRAFTSSICAGYLVSESVYFAQPSWLTTAEQVFKDIQESCEPSVFSLERLLFSIATDGRSHVDVLKQVLPMVVRIRQQELDNRKELYALGLKSSERLPLPEASIKRRKSRPAPDEDGDYECEICRANLFVSLVTNSHEEGVYCLPHASQLLTKKRHHLKFCKLMYTYDQSELNELVQKLKDRIEVKSQRKPLVKHCSSSSQKT